MEELIFRAFRVLRGEEPDDINQRWFDLLKDILESQKPAPIHAPWSVCEIRLPRNIHEILTRDFKTLSAFDFQLTIRDTRPIFSLGGHRFSSRLTVAFVFTLLISELGRRFGTEGAFWPKVSRQLADISYYSRLFTANGQPTSLSRQLIQEATKQLNLRHVFGERGHQEWYISIFLQFGFTHGGFLRRLPEWLSGHPTSLAIDLLLTHPSLASQSFRELWGTLIEYRKQRISKEQFQRRIEHSPWILPEWIEELAELARQRLQYGIHETVPEINDNDYFGPPRLIWDGHATPHFALDPIVPDLIDTSSPELAVDSNRGVLTRFLRQNDGSYVPANSEPVRVTPDCPELETQLRDGDGTPLGQQRLLIYDVNEDFSVFEMTTGRRTSDAQDLNLVQGRTYALLLYDELEVFPDPMAEYPVGNELRLVLLPLLEHSTIEIRENDEIIYTWTVEERYRPDLRNLKVDCIAVQDGGTEEQCIIRLHLPENVRLEKARVGKRVLPLPSTGIGTYRSQPFSVTPTQVAEGIRLRLTLKHGTYIHYATRKIVPLTNAALMHAEGTWQQVNPQQVLSAYPCRHHPFALRVAATNPESDIPEQDSRKHFLIEGQRPQRIVDRKPRPLGHLTALGESLSLSDRIYNPEKSALEVAGSVYDQGILAGIQDASQHELFLDLHTPIHWRDGHRLLAVLTDLSVVEIPVTEQPNVAQRLRIPLPDSARDFFLLGLFFNECRLGMFLRSSQWAIKAINGSNGNGSPCQWAEIIKVFRFPFLKKRFFKLLRPKLLEDISGVLSAWMNDTIILGDDAIFENQWDDSWEYATNQLIGLRPLSLSQDSTDELFNLFEKGGRHDSLSLEDRLVMISHQMLQISPRLAADTVRHWCDFHRAELPRGRTWEHIRSELSRNILQPLGKNILLERVAKEARVDEGFLEAMLPPGNNRPPHWERNVRRLLNVPEFRVLLTHYLLGSQL